MLAQGTTVTILQDSLTRQTFVGFLEEHRETTSGRGSRLEHLQSVITSQSEAHKRDGILATVKPKRIIISFSVVIMGCTWFPTVSSLESPFACVHR